MPKAKDITSLTELKPDPRNARRRTERGSALLVASLQAYGAARSVVIDESGEVLAGNGVVEAAKEAGLTKVRVIDADGDTLIAVRRSGLTPEQKRELAIADNRTGELAIWDAAEIHAAQLEGVDLSKFWTEVELDLLISKPSAEDWSQAAGKLPQGDREGFQQVAFILSDAQVAIVKAAVARAKAAGEFEDTGNANSNGNAIARICEAYP